MHGGGSMLAPGSASSRSLIISDTTSKSNRINTLGALHIMKAIPLAVLLFLPVLAACFDVKIDGPDTVQYNQTINVTVFTDPNSQDIKLHTVELHFPTPQKILNYYGATCVLREADKCKVVFWRPDINFNFISNRIYSQAVEPEFCLEDGDSMFVQIVATGECPNPYFRIVGVPGDVKAENGYACSSLTTFQQGILENVTVESYFRSLGGNGTLILRMPETSEVITEYDPQCIKNPCGVYANFTKVPGVRPVSFQVCGNTTNSIIEFTNITSWWRLYNYSQEVVANGKTIQVKGKPVIDTATYQYESAITGTNITIFSKVRAECGKITPEVTCKSNDTDIANVTSPEKVNLELSNGFFDILNWTAYLNSTGKINFTITAHDGVFDEYLQSDDLNITVNPHGCPGNYTYCGGKCALNPKNCTQECATGGTVCIGENVFCLFHQCGGACPDDKSLICTGLGECVPPGREGWKCDCPSMCRGSYVEAELCYYHSACNGTCSYLSTSCNATCTATGCCGDGTCEETETCLSCPEDCGCDDGNPCTQDSCIGICLNEYLPCGVQCPEGKCDGKGNCLGDLCCNSGQCRFGYCKRGVCVNNQCKVDNYTCIPCPEGYCFEGECALLKKNGQTCECQNSCEAHLNCISGRCSTCLNGICEPEECRMCTQDCTQKECARIIFLQDVIRIGGFILFILLVLVGVRILR